MKTGEVFTPHKNSSDLTIAGFYPINESKIILGDVVNRHPNVVSVGSNTYDSKNNLIDGKFTNGDFTHPSIQPSFMPAETFNLIIDNINSLIWSFEKTPNNKSQTQLAELFSEKALKNTAVVRDIQTTSEIKSGLTPKAGSYDYFPTYANVAGNQNQPSHAYTAAYRSPNYNYSSEDKITNIKDLVNEEYFRIEEDKRLFKSIGEDYMVITHLDARLEKDLAIRDAAIALRAPISSPEFTGIPRAPLPAPPRFNGSTDKDFVINAPMDQLVTIGYAHALLTNIIGLNTPISLNTLAKLANSIGNKPDFKQWLDKELALRIKTTDAQYELGKKVDKDGGEHIDAKLTGIPVCPTPKL